MILGKRRPHGRQNILTQEQEQDNPCHPLSKSSDAEGRTTVRTSKTTGQTESYVWNRRGQLTQIDVHSNASLTNLTGQVNYSYDPTGRRTSVRNQTGIGSGSYAQTVDYLMSDGDQVGQILGATGQTTRRFRYGIGVDSVLSEQRFSGGTASNPEYQLTDHLGTVRGVAQRTTGVNAAVVNTLQYDSFGKLISQSNASKQPYHGFAGRDIEPVGGLTYNRNRYYSTQTGRFISQDPIGFNAGDENLYRYVGNSPTNATDPTGLWGSPVSGGDPVYFMRQWFNRHFNYGAGYATGGSTHLGPTGTIHSNYANGIGGMGGGIIRYSTAGLANGLTEPPELRSYASQQGFEDSSEVLRLTPLAPSVPTYHLLYGEHASGSPENRPFATIELTLNAGTFLLLAPRSTSSSSVLGSSKAIVTLNAPETIMVKPLTSRVVSTPFLTKPFVRAPKGTFPNQMAANLAEEMATAARVGAKPIPFGAKGTSTIVNSGTIKYVVTESGELIISPHTINGVEISHAVLSGGRPVLAAGQADIVASAGKMFGIDISRHSGHFMPTEESLAIAREAFKKCGVVFPN
jgi:RHS repeat-associated protein